MVKDFTRSITHWSYSNPDKLKKYYHRVEKKLSVKYKVHKNTKWSKSDFKLINEDFVVKRYAKLVTPVIGGGISLAFLSVYIFPSNEPFDGIDISFILILSTCLLFFIIYGITQPKKEHILSRKDGLITMSGFFWQKNITMPFEKVEFAYSTGGENATGAFRLEAIRPNKWQTFDLFDIFGGDCYNEMTFIAWYMDKNRPLPPNTEFDRYRKQDFERRKVEGFPKPLYPSKIKTPEATKEQQAERKKIGGW